MRTTFAIMEHLATEAVVAFVDGELGMTAYQRAAAHLRVCAECAADVDAQQCARTAVRTAAPCTMPETLRGVLFRIPENSTCRENRAFQESSPGPQQTLPPPVDTPVVHHAPRGRRPLPLGVLAVSLLAAGVLAGTVAAPDPASTEHPLQATAVPPQRGAEVVAANGAPNTQFASFGAMFPGTAGRSSANHGAAQLESSLVELGQTPVLP